MWSFWTWAMSSSLFAKSPTLQPSHAQVVTWSARMANSSALGDPGAEPSLSQLISASDSSIPSTPEPIIVPPWGVPMCAGWPPVRRFLLGGPAWSGSMLRLADRFGVLMLMWSSASSDDDIDDNGESGSSLMMGTLGIASRKVGSSEGKCGCDDSSAAGRNESGFSAFVERVTGSLALVLVISTLFYHPASIFSTTDSNGTSSPHLLNLSIVVSEGTCRQ